jgi:hypothetical protein
MSRQAVVRPPLDRLLCNIGSCPARLFATDGFNQILHFRLAGSC